MANNIYQDLLRQTQEEIARKGTQAQEQERNRRQQAGIPSVRIKQTPASKSIIGTGAQRPAYSAVDLQNPYAPKQVAPTPALVSKMIQELEAEERKNRQQEAEERKNRKLERDYQLGQLRQYHDALLLQKDIEEYNNWTEGERRDFSEYMRMKGNVTMAMGSTGSKMIANSPEYQQAKATYEALENKYGKDRLDEIGESVKRYENDAEYRRLMEEGIDLGEKLGFGSIALSVPVGIATGLETISGGAMSALGSTGRYLLPDANAGRMSSAYSGGLNAGGSKTAGRQLANLADIIGRSDPNMAGTGGLQVYTPGELYESMDDKGRAGFDTAGRYAYQATYQAADNLVRAYMGGPGGKAVTLGLAGLRSFADAENQAIRNGATQGRAAANGLVNAALEVGTEFIPLDSWWKIAEESPAGFAQMLLRGAKQIGAEVTTEEINFIGQAVAEYAILRGTSEGQIAIRERMGQGMSREQAEAEGLKDLMAGMLDTAITTAMSSGVSVTAANVNARLRNQGGQAANTRDMEDTAARNAAPSQNQESSRQIPGDNQGNGEIQKQAGQPKQVDPVARASEYYAQNGRVSNSVAEKVLADPAAVQELQERTGITIPGVMEGATHTQKRNAVKSAIAQLVGERPGVSKQGAVDTFVDSMQEIQEGKPGTEAAPEQAGYAANAELDAAIGPDLRGERPGNSVDSVQPGQYNNGNEQNGENGYGSQQNDGGRSPENPAPVDDAGKPVGGGQQSDTAKSRTYTNPGSQNGKRVQMAYKNVLAENPEAGDYQVKHQADTLETAQGRVSTPEKAQAEYQNLMGKEVWDADDVATANLLQDRILRSGDPDAANKFADLAAKKQETLTQMGQAINAAQIKERGMKNAETTATAVDSFISSINSMEQSSTTYNAKKAGKDFADWKKDLCAEATRIGIAIESLEDGDAAGMREIIRQIAAKRKTTAIFGRSDQLTANARRILNKLDFDTLKKIANTQIAAMPDDFRRRSVKEVAMGIRKNNMLSSIKTFARNNGGNLATGVFDPFSEGTSGRIADLLLSKFTGIQTIGNEFNQAGTWIRGARDAADFSALCVELDIPIETDADASFAAASSGNRGGKYVGKTFRPTGNPAMRFMYAYQKYMSYALEVSDKIFEGGSNAAVTQSLQNMDFPGLEDADVQRIAAYTANRRTFKDATFKDSDGKVKGSNLSRATQAMKRGAGNYFGAAGEIAGDIAMPFASVPMNVQQTGIDYTAGTVKAVAEIAGIIRDVKAGKQIDPVRQRNAASDFGRGVTGIGMVALFTAAAATGVLRVSNAKDKDEKALAQAEGRSGAQLNWSAMLRGMKGESTDWQTGDAISSLDFLEPFNTQMYLGYELAQDDSVKDMAKAFPTAAFNSVLNSINDSPMMTGLAEIGDLISDVVDAESMTDKVYEVGGYLGDVASSYIPQFVRQTAQYSDGYYRDTRGENALEYAANKIKAAIPGLSKTLPVKYSGLGEPQKRGGFLETFVDPTATHVYHKNEVTGFLEELKEKTGVSSFIPDRQAPMSIRVDGETVNLDGTARETYQKTYGELVNSYYSGLMNSQTFRNMSEEAQAEALIKAESYAKEHAKSAVSGYNTDKPKEAEAVTGEIIRSVVQSDFSDAFSDLTDGADGAAEALARAYEGYKGLTFDDKKIFLENATGRVKWMIDAGAAGMDAGTFAEMYQQYRDIDGSDKVISQKANAWSYALQEAYERGDITQKQMQTLKKDMVFRYSGVVDTPKFDSMVEAGISGGDAKKVVDLLAGLKPESGYKSVRYIQNAEAIVNSGLSNGDTVEALYAYLPNSQDENLREMLDMGFSAQDYVQAWRLYDSESGEGKKRRTIDSYRSMFGVDYGTAKMIYELYG